MKIKTVEEASHLYDVVYDLPDEFIDEFDKIRNRAGLNTVKKFLDKHTTIISKKQRDNGYDFKLLKFEKGEDIVANTYRTELIFNKDFRVPYYEDVEFSVGKVIKEKHNVNVKKCASGDNSFIVFADAPMRSSQVYDILDALGYHELNPIKVYCEDDVNEYRRNYKVVATEKGWRVR